MYISYVLFARDALRRIAGSLRARLGRAANKATPTLTKTPP